MENQNGLFSSDELIDSMIVDCNNIPKRLAEGQYIAFCGLIFQLGQKLARLKEGVKNDLKARDDSIEELKRTIDEISKNQNGGG